MAAHPGVRTDLPWGASDIRSRHHFPSFGVGLSCFFHATLSHHFGCSSDQIRSMCIALSFVYE